MMRQTLVALPPIRFYVATEKLAKRCPRCKAKIKEGQKYLKHSEGDLHVSCLRSGQSKAFIGKSVCR